MKLNIHDRFSKELPADPNKQNTRRQVQKACFSYVTPKQPSKPSLVHANLDLAQQLGIVKEDLQSQDFLNVFSGVTTLEKSRPYAMNYGGHQFGHWAGQLGDGRAINLAEIKHKEHHLAIQLKGAGETPYSRSADGLAVLRSSIREYLCAEAMHHLGVPTTRSLSIIKSGDQVMRDMMYDGNAAYETGAIVCRVSPSFIRFGNFQLLAFRQDIGTLKKLTDFTIKHHFKGIEAGTKQAYIDFFREVSMRTLGMIMHWQRVGFVHGVMNTDNMSILGLTIDYGPYGWLEGFDPSWTPNTTDKQHKRYRYGNQAQIALWNLLQLANALYPLVNDAKAFEDVLNEFGPNHKLQYESMMRDKLGLHMAQENDMILFNQLNKTLVKTETDMTIFYRLLAEIKKDDHPSLMLNAINLAFYEEDLDDEVKQAWLDWFGNYKNRLLQESLTDLERKKLMHAVNPKYVLRNYMAQLAIDDAEKGDYTLVTQFYEMLKHPYDEQAEYNQWFAKRPEWARHRIGCSMLSCSS